MHSKIPPPIRKSTLAAFLRRFGPYNASLIRGLQSIPVQASDGVIFGTQLCVFHTPGLETLNLRVDVEEGIHWDESPDYYHPDWPSPFWCNGPIKLMYRALQRFVDRVSWLRVLEYERGENMQFSFQEPDAMREIRELEDLVTGRAAVGRTLDDKE